jgi:hypothetical protein
MRQEINKKKETGEGGSEIAWSTAVLLFLFCFSYDCVVPTPTNPIGRTTKQNTTSFQQVSQKHQPKQPSLGSRTSPSQSQSQSH